MDVDDRVLAPGVIQDALRRRRLAGIDMGDDADIADIGKRQSYGPYRSSITVEPAVPVLKGAEFAT